MPGRGVSSKSASFASAAKLTSGVAEIFQCGLNINSGRDWELASCRRDLPSRHAEVFEQGLAQVRPSKTLVADRKDKSHAAFIVDSLASWLQGQSEAGL